MKRKPKVVQTRPAGINHQVVTVIGGGSGYCTEPCATCPWRKDAVGEFPASAFRHSANTAYDMASEAFACHAIGAEHPTLCAGFLLRGSQHNLSIRLKLIKKEIDPSRVTDGGVELFDNYRAMAVANGVKRNDPSLQQCRD